MNKKLTIGALSLTLLLTACSGGGANVNNSLNNQNHNHNHAEENHNHNDNSNNNLEADEHGRVHMDISLAEWEGDWNSIAEFIDTEESRAALKELAEREGITEEEAKAQKEGDFGFPFGSLNISGDRITFNQGTIDHAEKAVEADYTYKESIEMEHAGKKYYFHAFETDQDGVDKYLLLTDIHGEETLAHFHAKMGDDIDELMAREDWYPTFIRPDTDMELIAEEIAE